MIVHQFSKSDSKNDICPICMEPYNFGRKARENKCLNGHEICRECLNTMIVQGMPVRCPECREQLQITRERVREALHIEMTSIWQQRRMNSQRRENNSGRIDNDQQIQMPLPLSSGRRPEIQQQNIVRRRQPAPLFYSFAEKMNSLVLTLIFSGYQWSVIVVTLMFFLSTSNYLPMTSLYILIIQLMQLLKKSCARGNNNTRQTFLHQLCFFMYCKESFCSSIATIVFYSLNWGIAATIYTLSLTAGKSSQLAIPAMVLNIGQFFMSVVFYKYLEQILETFESSVRIVSKIAWVTFSIGQILKIIVFGVRLWPMLVVSSGCQLFALAILASSGRFVIIPKSQLWFFFFLGYGVPFGVQSIRSGIFLKKLFTFLILSLQYLICPIMLGYVTFTGCQKLQCIGSLPTALTEIAFSISLFSPIINTLSRVMIEQMPYCN